MLRPKTKATPKLSVVIPSFNKSKYIGKTLESIFTQKYENLEVVIQDGGSSDGTLEIIGRFAKKYPGIIKIESKRDNGQLDAVNKGLAKTNGELLTFINADDVYVKGAFSVVSEMYKKNSNKLWFSGRGIVIDSDGREIAKPFTAYKNILFNLNKYSFLLMTNYLIQPSIFFTREAYAKFGPFTGTEKFIMEYEFWLKLGRTQMPEITNTVFSKFRIEASTKTKLLFNSILYEDEKIIRRFTKNSLILVLHNLNNIGRKLVGRFF